MKAFAGRSPLDGVKAVRIQGEEIRVAARIRMMDEYSGHADGSEITRWIAARRPIQRGLFLVHGEEQAIAGLAARVAERGATLLDAPVLGSQVSIQQGKLLIMVGGDKAALERIRPTLEAIGPKVFHVGDVGQAKTMKIALNLQLSTQILALSEGLLLAVKSGISRYSSVRSSAFRCRRRRSPTRG